MKKTHGISDANSDEFGTSHSYLVCAFQSNQCERIWTTARTAGEAIQNIRQSGCLVASLLESASEIVETEIVVLGNYPSGVAKGYRHTLSDTESARPDIVFIGAINSAELKSKQHAANILATERELDLQRRIEAAASLTAISVLFEDLPERWRHRIRYTAKGCWIWKTTAEVAPYKAVYIKTRGPVPKGAVLRHSCDNRRCVNPNHLSLGSPLDNVCDMVSRRRHRSQRARRRKRH